MNVTQFLFFILFDLLIIINTINGFYGILENPRVPCGLRYNDHNILENLPPPIGEISGRSFLKLESRALDDIYSEKKSDTTANIAKKKKKLNEILNKIRKGLASFDQNTKKSFERLIDDYRKVLPRSIEWQIELNSTQNVKEQEDKFEFEEKKALIEEARLLLNQIDKNLNIKTRIIGGKQASIKEFPWLVSIQILDGIHICGGSIISSSWILTSAHCVTKEKTNGYIDRRYVVGVGSSFWRKATKYNVVMVIKHPGFTFEEFRHDIALMKVEPSIRMMREKVVPICLPPRNAEVYGSATIAGWGLTNNDKKLPNEYLMRVNIEILNDAYCARRYQNYNRNQMICAGQLNGERDSCQGDSGGPMQCLLGDGRVYLIGAVSFGDKCGRASYPGVYTKETSYVDWVYNQIENEAAGFFIGRSMNETSS